MRIYKVLLFCLSFFAVERFCHLQTDGFALGKIYAKPQQVMAWTNPPADSHVQRALSQPFHYLGSGGTCYVFASADEKYVLKFFKHHHLKKEKKQRVYTSCKEAFEKLKKETALVYVHLERTPADLPTVTLIDKLGIAHKVPLDGVDFLLQKKAEMAYSYLQRLFEMGAISAAENALRSIENLGTMLVDKGFYDLDPKIETNLGFIDGNAVKIDVGPLVYDARFHEQSFAKRKKIKWGLRLNKWLSAHFPAGQELLNDQSTN